MAVIAHLCIGSPLTWTSICSGRVIIPFSSKYSVIGTLQHRANTICSNAQWLHKEEKHLHQALKRCQYPNWALNKVNHKMKNPGTRTTTNRNNNITQRSYIVVPYYAGLSENIQNIGRKFGCRYIVKEELPSRTS